MTLRLGIDVGGTNTDAVVIGADGSVLSTHKTATTPDPFDGIVAAIEEVIAPVDTSAISRVMLGTTHPANAIIQRRHLARVGVLRLAAPSSTAVPPGAAWPQDLRRLVMGPTAIVGGGFEYDGTEIAPLDVTAIRTVAWECARAGLSAIAVSCAFSPAGADHELRAAEIVAEETGGEVATSLSHQVGTLGLLERENATILNAALLGVARRVIDGLERAIEIHGLSVEPYLTQNDGTVMNAATAVRFPILTVGSGPTNSMRGASALAETGDALVCDVGGTSTDVGVMTGGFPRESAFAVEIGGVRTNFRMPDLVSIGLGGGSIVRAMGDEISVGPESVGYQVSSRSLAVGGDVATLTDVAVKLGRMEGFGDPALLRGLSESAAQAAIAWVDRNIQNLAERMKASRHRLPLIAVGGGSPLVARSFEGVSEVVRPAHHAVANAYGAAIAEASGAVDRVYRYQDEGRDRSLASASEESIASAVAAGADPDRVRIISLVEIPLSYVPGGSCRVQVKAAGPLAG